MRKFFQFALPLTVMAILVYVMFRLIVEPAPESTYKNWVQLTGRTDITYAQFNDLYRHNLLSPRAK